MKRKPVSRLQQAGDAFGEALHNAGDAVGNLTEEAQRRAARAGEMIRGRADRAWPDVRNVGHDLYETQRRLRRSITRQPDYPMLWSLATGLAVGYVAGWLIHRR
jgi:DNA-binding transcriptional regulator PaaX